jgi:hypothetical protein
VIAMVSPLGLAIDEDGRFAAVELGFEGASR